MTERFAIYFAPAATSNLWDRAATWLGRDASDGRPFDGPVAGIDRDRLLNLTQSANRYGFHATIKAPMALADGATEADLRAALAEFAPRHQPIDLGQILILDRLAERNNLGVVEIVLRVPPELVVPGTIGPGQRTGDLGATDERQ